MATEAAMQAHDTLPQGVITKVKKNTTCTVTRATGGKNLTSMVTLRVKNRQFYMQ